jgi:hypothetical protein
MQYLVEIDGGQGGAKYIAADSPDEALRHAQAWAEEGDWDTPTGTVWVSVRVLDDDGNALAADDSYAIDPPEPDCLDDQDHDWRAPQGYVGGIAENPGCWGHGGGVIYHEVCVLCGCRKTTDTWAQNPDNGVQGLTSIKYEPRYYDVTYYIDEEMCSGADPDRVAELLWDNGYPVVADPYQVSQNKTDACPFSDETFAAAVRDASTE